MQAEPEQAQGAPPNVESNGMLQSFLVLNSAVDEIWAGQTLFEAPDELLYENEAAGDLSTIPLCYDGEELIFSSRIDSNNAFRITPEFEAIQTKTGELSAVLSCLNSATADIPLPAAKYYIYDPSFHRFPFAHEPPNYIFLMMTLAKSIELDLSPAINILSS